MNPTPISLIVDDPCPGLHMYYLHAALRDPRALTSDGRPLLKTIPNSMLERFCNLADEFDLRGKFSIVPRPGAAGSINSQIEGVPVEEMHAWLDLARRRVVPRFDVTPEMITHDWAIELATLRPLAENEHDWSQHQTVETLRPYIAFALGELKQAGFDATGVTSPWSFGIGVEHAYARAILEAQQQVYGRQDTWYFLRFSDAVDTTAQVMIRETDDLGTRRSCVSVIATCSDFIWQTIDTPRTDAEYIGEVADRYLTADGKAGRIRDIVDGGGEVVLCTHWQSLFSNGTMAGLQVLADVCRRVRETLGDAVRWTKCSELAAAAVARAGAV
ncbi:MAG: hypothetical protein WCP21_04250 [Armatimonadota bacterium]